MSIRVSRPKGALRFLLRLPTHLYHAGLGWLLGHRFMLLTHRGRKSGRLYETVLEVPVYHRRTRTSYVMSGWGDKADWYRNIEVQPAVRVQTRRDSYAPAQHVLAPQEVVRVWEEFRRRHPIEEKIALRLYSQRGQHYRNDQERREALLGLNGAKLENLRVVAFRPLTTD